MLTWVEHEKNFITSGPGSITFLTQLLSQSAYARACARMCARVYDRNTGPRTHTVILMYTVTAELAEMTEEFLGEFSPFDGHLSCQKQSHILRGMSNT